MAAMATVVIAVCTPPRWRLGCPQEPAMTDLPALSTTIGIAVLKKSEDLAQSQVAQLIAPLAASAAPATAPEPSDSASFSPAALAQLALTQSGAALLR
jgi:hypothetical protein